MEFYDEAVQLVEQHLPFLQHNLFQGVSRGCQAIFHDLHPITELWWTEGEPLEQSVWAEPQREELGGLGEGGGVEASQ